MASVASLQYNMNSLDLNCSINEKPESLFYSDVAKCNEISDYKTLGIIGHGSYGVVYKAQFKKTSEIFALKKCIGEEGLDEFAREASLLTKLNHDNVVKLHDIVTCRRTRRMFLVLEHCITDLGRIIQKQTSPLSEPVIKCLMHQLLSGLLYLHSNSVIHRDINVSNLLFKVSGELKISDFGSAALIEPNVCLTPNVGTRWYIAPEILFLCESYTTAVDMWSVGCVFAELLKNTPIFPGKSEMDMISLMIEMLGTPNEDNMPGFSLFPLMQSFDLVEQPKNLLRQTFNGFSDCVISLLMNFLCYNCEKRLNAQQALSDEYFVEEPSACDLKELTKYF